MRAFVADRIRAAGTGRAGHPEHTALALTALVDGIAAHVLTEQCAPEDAEAALDDHLDTIFGS